MTDLSVDKSAKISSVAKATETEPQEINNLLQLLIIATALVTLLFLAIILLTLSGL